MKKQIKEHFPDLPPLDEEEDSLDDVGNGNGGGGGSGGGYAGWPVGSRSRPRTGGAGGSRPGQNAGGAGGSRPGQNAGGLGIPPEEFEYEDIEGNIVDGNGNIIES